MTGVDDILCDYCGEPSELLTGAEVYPRSPKLANLYIYVCQPCDARVGCHKGTMKPLGRLANAELRKAKQRAHAEFDPLWKRKMKQDGCSQKAARGAGYEWLADQLGIDRKKCHIGMFDVETCNRAVDICKPYNNRYGDKAA